MNVSVIIPTYNSGQFIGECIESVFCQTVQPSEIIVVDDGSDDGTEQVVRQYLPRISYIRQDNQGPSAARNTGVRQASGEWIAFLDADDIWLESKLETQLRYLQKNPQFSMVITDMYQGANPSTDMVSTFSRFEDIQEGKIFRRLLRSSYVYTPTVILKTAVFKEYGGFDETMNMMEDLDLFLKIARDYEIGVVREILVFRRRHCDNISGSRGARKRRARFFAEVEERCGPFTVDDRRLAKRQWARSMWEHGYECMHCGAYREARRCFWQSMVNGHRVKVSMFFLSCTFLPRRVFIALKSWKAAWANKARARQA